MTCLCGICFGPKADSSHKNEGLLDHVFFFRNLLQVFFPSFEYKRYFEDFLLKVAIGLHGRKARLVKI